MQKGKKFKRRFIFLLVTGGYIWLTFVSLKPCLPSPSDPLIFYSNHIHSDLKSVLLQAMKNTKNAIFFQIYGLTDPDVIALLSHKIAQGLDVQIFYDSKGSCLPKEFPGTALKGSGLMHRKIFLFDRATAFLGTANATTQSLKMHDNFMVGIYSPKVNTFLRNACLESGSFQLGQSSLELYLLPDLEGKALDSLSRRLDLAKDSIRIAMFTFTHPLLVEKLIQAKQRGIEVEILIDRYTASGASKKHCQILQEAGIKVRHSMGGQLFHHKWAILDEKTLILGSANWTKAAFEKNHDFLLIFDNLTNRHRKSLKRIWRAVAIASENG